MLPFFATLQSCKDLHAKIIMQVAFKEMIQYRKFSTCRILFFQDGSSTT